MIAAQRERVLDEWRSNRRLRLAVLVIVLVGGVHLALSASERRAPDIEEYRRDAELVERLREASTESAWPARADEAGQRLAALHEGLPQVASTGLAQAELQAWLAQQAQGAGLGEPTVRVETTLDVPGHPELWQVLARLDATVPEGRLGPFLQAVAGGLPWIQVERLDVTGTRGGQRVVLTARGYYRKPADGSADADAAGATGNADAAAGDGA